MNDLCGTVHSMAAFLSARMVPITAVVGIWGAQRLVVPVEQHPVDLGARRHVVGNENVGASMLISHHQQYAALTWHIVSLCVTGLG